MKIFHSYGSKERLFEMFERVNRIKLNEEMLPVKNREVVIDEFVNYVDEKLDFGNDKPDVVVSYDENEAKGMTSFGKYTPSDGQIRVVAAKRNLADILRTLAHELVHYKQNQNGILEPHSGDDGTEQENEANSIAGVLMREFGKKNPIIFE
jgi:Zn-dependent peptidase ImmA (M78 family)